MSRAAAIPSHSQPLNVEGLGRDAHALSALWPLFAHNRACLLAGLLLTCSTLFAGLALLGLSAGFLAAAAIAGLTPATAILFNFFPLAAGVRFFAIARTASRWGERVVTHEATFRLLARIRVWVYRSIAPLSLSQLGRYHGGDLLGRITRDVDALDNLFQRTLLPAGAALLMLALLAGGLALLSPALALPVVAIALLGLALGPLLAFRAGRELAPALIEHRSSMRRLLLDCVDGLADYAIHAPAWAKMRSLTLGASEAWLSDQRRLARRAAAMRAMLGAGVALAAWAGLGLAAALPAGQLGGPWLAVVVVVLLGCAELVQALPAAFIELPGTFAAARRLGELARQAPKPAFVAAGPMPVDASIELRSLCYERERGLALIENASIGIRAGEHLALVGPSGCGKSSLLALLARLESPDAGQILIGGVSAELLDESTLRSHVCCVAQDDWIFNATIAENLRLARPDADDARLREVLSLAGLDETLAQWPDGLETWVEEGGASLSGGQRRRLAIARALLRDAAIYLFDEATEGLDEMAEVALIYLLREQLAGRTLIWVTHKPLGLTSFDRVISLENGRLAAAPGQRSSGRVRS